ncbi:MAG: hypothetical protein DRJ61_18615 [Acidobacteria bacterium]|nr:MAG: hypothetical protein DRJ61_18615 [Acidobacteriota bacterium]
MLKLKSKENFCVVPWIHLYCRSDGSMVPCCLYKEGRFGNINEDISKIYNNKYYKIFRKNMLNDQIDKKCENCLYLEKLNGYSIRNNFNNIYLTPEFEHQIISNTKPDGTYNDVNIKSFDIRFSNKCNFKCRMCGIGSSNRIFDYYDYPKEHKSLYNFTSIKNIKEWFNVNLKYLQQLRFLYIAGGEPFIEDKHFEFLECCIENKIFPTLFYQTNGSVLNYKNWDIFKLWKNFDVKYSISIDGVGYIGKYIRPGFDEQQVFKNIEKFNDYFKDEYNKLIISVAISAYNIYYIIELLDELEKRKIYYNDILLNNVTKPEYLQTNVISDRLKRKSIDKIIRSKWYKIYYDKLKPILNLLKIDSTIQTRDQFKKYTMRLDKIEKTNIKKNITTIF